MLHPEKKKQVFGGQFFFFPLPVRLISQYTSCHLLLWSNQDFTTLMLFHPLTADFPHLLCKPRTLHPWAWGAHTPTGTVDSLWELQEKERESIFLSLPPPWNRSCWLWSPCSFSPRANLVPCPYVSLAKHHDQEITRYQCPITSFSHFPLLATAETFTGGQTLDITIVHHSYTSLAGCWCGPTAGTPITCRVERVTMRGNFPLAIREVLEK